MKLILKKVTSKGNSHQEFEKVVPESNIYFNATLGHSYHKCSYCGYGYKIAYTASAVYLGFGSTITCPKCGNTEPYDHY